MICQACRERFDVCDAHTRYESVPYGEGDCRIATAIECPTCGAQTIDEERLCGHCEQEYAPSELTDGLCAVCAEETHMTLSWMWDMLSPAQRRYAAEHTHWMDE